MADMLQHIVADMLQHMVADMLQHIAADIKVSGPRIRPRRRVDVRGSVRATLPLVHPVQGAIPVLLP
jgi:hypothetical protein